MCLEGCTDLVRDVFSHSQQTSWGASQFISCLTGSRNNSQRAILPSVEHTFPEASPKLTCNLQSQQRAEREGTGHTVKCCGFQGDLSSSCQNRKSTGIDRCGKLGIRCASIPSFVLLKDHFSYKSFVIHPTSIVYSGDVLWFQRLYKLIQDPAQCVHYISNKQFCSSVL